MLARQYPSAPFFTPKDGKKGAAKGKLPRNRDFLLNLVVFVEPSAKQGPCGGFDE